MDEHQETNASPKQTALATAHPNRPRELTAPNEPLAPSPAPGEAVLGRRGADAADRVAAELVPHLVALLFAADEPLAIPEAARVLGGRRRDVERAADLLADAPPIGLMVQRDGDRLQLATTPASAPYVRRLRGLEEQGRLSRAALEVLAVVAYRQPITRAEIEAVRGVGGDRALATLLQRELIEEVGRKETVGRPVLFGTTLAFLKHAGLRSLDDLPALPAPDGHPIAAVDGDITLTQLGAPADHAATSVDDASVH